MGQIRVAPATADTWPHLRGLFGRSGADNGCWCQYWLLGAEYHRRDRSRNRDDLEAQVRTGGVGFLAYRDDTAVGWARVTPRHELDWLTSRFRLDEADDPLAVACFYIARSERGTGIMTALLEAAVAHARSAGVSLEVYPIDDAVQGATRNRFSGVLPAFIRAGFVEVDRLSADRALVRAV